MKGIIKMIVVPGPSIIQYLCPTMYPDHTFYATIYKTDGFVTVGGWSYNSIGDMFLDWDIPSRRVLIEKTGCI